MQRSITKPRRAAIDATAKTFRLSPGTHLLHGDEVGAFVDMMFDLDERPRFGPALHRTKASQHTEELSMRLLTQLGQIAQYSEATQTRWRPFILPVPTSVLEMPQLIDDCLSLLGQTKLCPQEIAFEFTDAGLVKNTGFDFGLFRALRMRGLRVSIDARKSWRSQLQPMSWLMVDTLRVPSDPVERDTALDNMISSAADAGVAIIAHRPKWRDGEHLAKAGIDFGFQPYADA